MDHANSSHHDVRANNFDVHATNGSEYFNAADLNFSAEAAAAALETEPVLETLLLYEREPVLYEQSLEQGREQSLEQGREQCVSTKDENNEFLHGDKQEAYFYPDRAEALFGKQFLYYLRVKLWGDNGRKSREKRRQILVEVLAAFCCADSNTALNDSKDTEKKLRRMLKDLAMNVPRHYLEQLYSPGSVYRPEVDTNEAKRYRLSVSVSYFLSEVIRFLFLSDLIRVGISNGTSNDISNDISDGKLSDLARIQPEKGDLARLQPEKGNLDFKTIVEEVTQEFLATEEYYRPSRAEELAQQSEYESISFCDDRVDPIIASMISAERLITHERSMISSGHRKSGGEATHMTQSSHWSKLKKESEKTSLLGSSSSSSQKKESEKTSFSSRRNSSEATYVSSSRKESDKTSISLRSDASMGLVLPPQNRVEERRESFSENFGPSFFSDDFRLPDDLRPPPFPSHQELDGGSVFARGLLFDENRSLWDVEFSDPFTNDENCDTKVTNERRKNRKETLSVEPCDLNIRRNSPNIQDSNLQDSKIQSGSWALTTRRSRHKPRCSTEGLHNESDAGKKKEFDESHNVENKKSDSGRVHTSGTWSSQSSGSSRERRRSSLRRRLASDSSENMPEKREKDIGENFQSESETCCDERGKLHERGKLDSDDETGNCDGRRGLHLGMDGVPLNIDGVPLTPLTERFQTAECSDTDTTEYSYHAGSYHAGGFKRARVEKSTEPSERKERAEDSFTPYDTGDTLSTTASSTTASFASSACPPRNKYVFRF